MKRVLTAVVLVPLVLLVVFKAPLWLFALVVALIAILALREYLDLLKAYGTQPLRFEANITALVVVFGIWCASDDRLLERFAFLQPGWLFGSWQILLIFSLIFGIPLIFRDNLRGSLLATAGSAFGVLYIVVPLALLIPLRGHWSLCVLVVFTLLSVWAGDTAAYYVGRAIGRHPLAPVVSPKKTWEGAIASVLASVLVAWVVFHFYTQIRSLFSTIPNISDIALPDSVIQRPMPLIRVIMIGFLTNVEAQLGDLFESAIKRGAQVKDSGSLLPGHGGILDRIDALLFAIPTVWYYAMLTHFSQPWPF